MTNAQYFQLQQSWKWLSSHGIILSGSAIEHAIEIEEVIKDFIHSSAKQTIIHLPNGDNLVVEKEETCLN